MANVKITDLTEDTTPVEDSLLELASLSGTTYASKKLKLSTLTSYVIGKWNALLAANPLTIARGGTGAASGQAALASLGAGWAIAKIGAPASVTGTTAETTLATITIPAGAMGPNGFIEILPLFTFPATSNSKTLKIRFGGAEVYSFVSTGTTTTGIRPTFVINNVNNASSQVAFGAANGLITTTAPLARTNVNTTAAVNLTITGAVGLTTEAITLESLLARISYGA